MVGVISSKNENIEFALTLFCEKDTMSRTVDSERSWSNPAAAGLDVAHRGDLYYARVEDLLRRLAETQTAKQHAVRAPLFGSWKMAAVCAACFICVPGCATAAAILLIKSNNSGVAPVEIETVIDPVSAKADRLPLIAPVTTVNYFNDANYFGDANPVTSGETGEVADAFEQPALRGTLEDIVLTTSPAEPPLAATRKLRRSVRSAFAKMPAETPEPAPRSPSLLEKLFSVLVSQFPQPTSQRQT
jgi:hypothetical protein